MDVIATLKKTREIMNKYGINAKKKFGQNFIINEEIIDRIVDVSNINHNTIVIEIGPGLGALTQKLLMKAKKVIAIEIDYTLTDILKEELKEFNNLEIINEDVLNIDLKALVNKYDKEDIVLVSNLPYYVTSDIMIKIFEADLKGVSLTVMMQKEVARRILKGENENLLTLLSKYYFDVKLGFEVSKNIFHPRPNVDSTILRYLHKQNRQLNKDQEIILTNLIKNLYTKKRKTLLNNLKDLYGEELSISLLDELNINQNERVEKLKLEDFIALVKIISQFRHQNH